MTVTRRAQVSIMVFIIMIGVALIDGKLWKLMSEQSRHNRAVEGLLQEIRDKESRS